MSRVLRTFSRLTATAVVSAGLVATGAVTSASQAQVPREDRACFTPQAVDDVRARGSSAARGGFGPDHRDISASEQRAIEARTGQVLAAQGQTPSSATAAFAGVDIPVYIHVMRSKIGEGDVTDAQIAQQIAVLNATYGGQESATASVTGFTFTLAGVDRFNNDQWHKDRRSTTYRAATRQGGANALNMWLVDFSYLGIATFPWDYANNPAIDGIRVNYTSLPGGSATNYDLGETATHEAGHWLGLYHTFQGGCTSTNDEVSDTPAQSSASSGCPEGRDSCSLPGTDPIHNYMDYSYDTCYTEFSAGQSARMAQMWTAYRA